MVATLTELERVREKSARMYRRLRALIAPGGLQAARAPGKNHDAAIAGFTLVELVVTLVVLSILTVGVAPLVKTVVRRQREQQLREALREMRDAIKQFKYDTELTPLVCAQGGAQNQQQQFQISSRSRVVVTDCKIFTTDNPDYYPPTLQTLVEGVNVIPRGGAPNTGGGGLEGARERTALGGATLATKKKIYLRKIPIDPMTGEADWDLRSCYQEADAGSWDNINVFDVRSKSKDEALNGEKYNDW